MKNYVRFAFGITFVLGCLATLPSYASNLVTRVPTQSLVTKSAKVSLPITLPIKQNKTISFANAVELSDQIPTVAWQNIQDAIALNSELKIPTTLIIGPNTDTTESRVLALLQKAYRLWNGFKQPPSFTGLIYNGKDEAWAESQWPKIASKLKLKINPKDYVESVLRAGCSFADGAATECWGGNAVVFPKTTLGFAFYGVQSPTWSDSNFVDGPISQVTHEYTHIVQFAQWNGMALKPGENATPDAAHKVIPCWFQEGQANAIGVPIASPDADSYVQTRDYQVRRPINQSKSPSLSNEGLTASALTSFLFNQKAPTCYKQRGGGDYQLGYNIGFAASEVLVAIGGPQSTMALVALTASGMTWAQAFQAVYGITWKEGSSILGKVLAQQYLAKPMLGQ